MAHYMAMHGSRFSYSHDTCHYPIYGIDGLLQQKDMVMNFRTVKGMLIPFHKAMNYVCRPLLLEAMCSYEFFQKVEVVSRNQAKLMDQECFEMGDDHPCQSNMVVVYRKRECVPVFPWRWLGSTAEFATNMHQTTQEGDIDFQKKEQYAYKFMLLFLPFRTDADLRLKESYILRWQLAYNQNEFQDAMIEVADNIQIIYNSLMSTNPESGKLASETHLDEMDDDDTLNDDNDDEVSFDDIMANIGIFFTEEHNTLTEEANVIDPSFAGQFFKGHVDKDTPIALNCVIQAVVLEDVDVELDTIPIPEEGRWTTRISQLNSLAMTCRLISGNHEEWDQVDSNGVPENNFIHANGTCKSIVLWGQNARLDPEQQCAFEILTATFVLTFYEDATVDVGEDTGFPERIKHLQHFARRKPNSGPLIMFVTGPAGAGKCK